MLINKEQEDIGLMTVLLDRFRNQRLPAAQAMLQKVKGGELLSDMDMKFLKEVSKDIDSIQPLLNRHPECNEIATGMLNLCAEIAQTDLKNEK